MTMLKVLCRRCLQNIIILIVRPYVMREFLGWGKVYAALVGDYKRDWLWIGGPIKTIRGKLHGYIMHLDLSKWSDRSTYFLGRWSDLEMQLFVNDLIKQGDTVVDVGANRGGLSLLASRLVGDAGKVICFEPNPSCLKILDQEIASNQIKNILINRVGLGEREEELALTVPRFNSGEGTFGRSAYGEEETFQVKVKIKKGDDFLTGQHPLLIKIDVEGFECNVIAGLTNTINGHHPIIVTEIVPQHLAACGFSVADLVGLMRRNGYEGYKLGLRKKSGRYAWEVSCFDMEGGNCDAVWIHPASNSDRVAMFNKRIRKL